MGRIQPEPPKISPQDELAAEAGLDPVPAAEPEAAARAGSSWADLRASWKKSWKRTGGAVRKQILFPVLAAVLSGIATPLLLDAIKGSEYIQTGSVSSLDAEFKDSLAVVGGAGSTKDTFYRRRCQTIRFAEPFKKPPRVLVALELIDAGYDGVDLGKLPAEASSWAPKKPFGAELELNGAALQGSPSIRVSAAAENIHPTAFDLCVATWSNTRLHSARATWLAVPAR